MKSDVVFLVLAAVLAIVGVVWFYLAHPGLALAAEIVAGLFGALFVRKRRFGEHPQSMGRETHFDA